MKFSTVLIIVGMFIISLYFLVEVNYYSSVENDSQNRSDSPYLEVPLIGVDQSINNKSVDYGVYHEPESAKPGSGTVVLFGHRTLHGSPFLKLDQLKPGDNITLAWPGIGNVEYRVLNHTIVPASYRLSVEQGNVLFLITCYPLGSSKERLVIKAKQEKIYPYQAPTATSTDDDQPYAIALIAAFFAGGMILSYFYPVTEDRMFLIIATLAMTLFLVLGYFFPTPASGIESQMSNISNILGV
ncbi:MAG TPA: class E sortase [Methanobacteriaceae archaeon]|nr:class E sortase [Methanobacteriaceae archaeon]